MAKLFSDSAGDSNDGAEPPELVAQSISVSCKIGTDFEQIRDEEPAAAVFARRSGDPCSRMYRLVQIT